jgi:hypothetical protein
MRRVASLLLLLSVFVWIACQWPATPQAESLGVNSDWRRTVDGWERFPFRQTIERHRDPPAVHPLLLGAIEILAMFVVLATFPDHASQDRVARLDQSDRRRGHVAHATPEHG